MQTTARLRKRLRRTRLPIAHEQTAHEDAQSHHHHTHAATSHHDGGHHLLQVEDLNVSFRMYDEDAPYFQTKQRDAQVLHGLSIAVHAGEIVAVVGASGSGKTLLAQTLARFSPMRCWGCSSRTLR